VLSSRESPASQQQTKDTVPPIGVTGHCTAQLCLCPVQKDKQNEPDTQLFLHTLS